MKETYYSNYFNSTVTYVSVSIGLVKERKSNNIFLDGSLLILDNEESVKDDDIHASRFNQCCGDMG